MMKEKATHRSYTQELKQSAKAISPSKEQCDRILQSVLAATEEERISYGEASEQVDKMSMFRVVHGLRGKVASPSGMLAFAAGLMIVASLGRLLPNRTNSMTIIDDHEVPLAADVPFDVPVARFYTVTPTEPIETVEGVDGQLPFMDRFLVEGDAICIYFSDPHSGVDWASIYAEDATGTRIPPVGIHETDQWVRFDLSQNPIVVYLKDLAGNSAKCIIERNP